jgi:hypothetical protein
LFAGRPQENVPTGPTPPTERPSPTPPPITIPPPGKTTVHETNQLILGERPKEMVPNRIRGKSHIICEESGVEFGFRPLFPFTGKIL